MGGGGGGSVLVSLQGLSSSGEDLVGLGVDWWDFPALGLALNECRCAVDWAKPFSI